MGKATWRRLQGQGGNVAKVASALIRGDKSAKVPLPDCLEEEGLTVSTKLEVGKSYYVETLSKYYVGVLVEENLSYLVFDEWAWIPDTGRFHETMSRGTVAEAEPAPKGTYLRLFVDVIMNIVDWKHKLPREVK